MPSPKHSLHDYPRHPRQNPIEAVRRKRRRMARGGEPILKALMHDITFYLCYILFVVALGPFQFGYHLAELNAPQDVITCEKQNVTASAIHPKLPQCISMNTDQFAVVTSIYTLGGFLGALLAGPACNRYGRVRAIRLTTYFHILGPIFQSLAPNIGLLCFGRLVSGVGSGAALVVVPIYISDIAPPKEKGLFGALTQIMVNVGILLTQVLGYFLSRDNLWRIILAVAGGVAVIQLFGSLTIPESPKWLAEHKHPQKARSILRSIRGRTADLDEEVKAWNVDSSQTDIEEEESLLGAPPGTHPSPTPKAASTSIGILKAFTHPSYRPAVVAVIAVMAAQQLTGINSIIMYSVSLLSTLLPTTAALLTVAVSFLNLLVTTLCAPLSDKIGRKWCILLSIAGMGTSSILLAAGLSHALKPLAAIATLTFVISFAVGLGPVPFILANELVGPEAVGATQSVALAANWIATFLVSQFFPILNEALGGKGRIYYIFAGFALGFGAFIAWWVPETRGKSGAEEVWGRREARERVE
ncbi:Bifunctional purine biosynthesis protein PurH [Lecanora helva]